jgi:hypothetical protein
MLWGKQGGDEMPYRITAISPEGAVSFRSKTPAEALETAVELMDFGLEGISITDAKGERHTPSDFARLYTDKAPIPKAPKGEKHSDRLGDWRLKY